MSKKVYIAITLLVLLIVVSVGVILAAKPASVKAVVVGVHVGDSFTYHIEGASILTGLDAVDTPAFSKYNDTDNYKITITVVNGTSVSFDSVWLFKNGTEVTGQQTIDLSNGMKSDQNGFWAVYSSNLNVGDLLRPTGFDGLTVNLTNTKTYAASTRERNFMSIDTESYLVTDPTGSTQRYDSTVVFFDKQTGMLETLTWITWYSNPEMREAITWNLVNSTVWAVQ